MTDSDEIRVLRPRSKSYPPAIFIAVVLVLFSAYWWAVISGIGPFKDADRGGVFGDAFGALTSLFNALAFAGLLIAILLQREELQLQRKELADTREVLSEQRKQLAEQAAAARQQVFESTFFRLLETLRDLVSKLAFPGHLPGVASVHMFAVSLRDHEGQALRRDITPHDAARIVTSWYESNEPCWVLTSSSL